MARTLTRARKPHRTRVSLSEDVSQMAAGARVDRKHKVIRDVLLLGFKSKNGRRYTLEAMKDAVARGLYEGRGINFDHPKDGPSGQRSIRDRFGMSMQTRVDPKRGIVGNVRYLSKDPYAEKILEAAEDMPAALGFSHNADGEEHIQGGVPTIEHILKVRHIDLVSDPATTRSLYESIQPRKRRRRMATKKTTRRVQTLELDDPLAPDMSGGALDADDGDEGGNLEEKAAEFIQELLGEFKAGSFDYGELKKKILKVLGVFEDEGGSDGGGPPELDDESDDDEGGDDEPPPKKKETEESIQDLDDDEEEDDYMDRAGDLRAIKEHPFVRRLVEQLDAHKVKGRMSRRRQHVRKLLTESHLPKEAITKTFLESLEAAKDDKAIKKLIEDRQSIIRGKKPVSRAPGNNGAQTMTAKDFASGILR